MLSQVPIEGGFSDGEVGWQPASGVYLHIVKAPADSISERSHDYAWEIAKMGEELPLYAYRVARIQEPSEQDIKRLKDRAKELGLL